MPSDLSFRAFLLNRKPPIGLGTDAAESIVSFLSRVADDNNLTLGEMIWGKVLGDQETAHPALAVMRGVASSSLAASSVSISKQGSEFAEAVAVLTGRDSVRLLNLHASTKRLSYARLLRKNQAWCAHCLVDGLYFRMLWDFRLASACPEHRCQLAQVCGKCGSPQRRYRCSGTLWNCQKCDEPLVATRTPAAASSEIAMATEIGDLVAEMTGGRLCLDGKLVKRALFSWADRQGATSVKMKARLLGMPPSLVSYWRRELCVASLQRILELCFLNGLPLLEICRGNPLVETRSSAPRNLVGTRAWQIRVHDEDKRKILREHIVALAESEFPPSLKSAARGLGVAPKTLKALDPHACVKLSKRFKAHQTLVREVRFIRFQNHVRRCIEMKAELGQAPTFRDIGLCLSKPGVLRSPRYHQHARREIKRAKAALTATAA